MTYYLSSDPPWIKLQPVFPSNYFSKFRTAKMYFCPICSNLLVTEQTQSIQLTCTTCPYIYRLNTILTHTEVLKTKTIDKILGNEDELKYANKCQEKCPKCSCKETLFLEIQTRSADEPSTIFYQCTRCKFNWKE